jgi:hypothetical protein
MDTRIRLKMGDIEVEYEGSEEFLKTELINFVSEVANLHQKTGLQTDSTMTSGTATDVPLAPPTFMGTTSTIADKLGSRSGSGLLIASAAHLTLVKGSQSFSRQELLEEMKTAKGYYKKTFSNNLSRYLQTVVKNGDLIETGKDAYSLSANKRKELERILAQ